MPGEKNPNGKKVIRFDPPPSYLNPQSIPIPCGQCTECRIRRRMELALRLEHESRYHNESWFCTPTYSDENLPYGGSLYYEHVSEFIRSLRRRTGQKIRYFAAGEYAPDTKRPHYHLILFGLTLPNPRLVSSRPIHQTNEAQIAKLTGQPLPMARYYKDQLLDDAWKKGHVDVTPVSPATMQYVAKYHIDKVTGPLAEQVYSRHLDDGTIVQVEPHAARMSNRPGLGAQYFHDFYPEMYPNGTIVKDGIEFKTPEYYDRLCEKYYPELWEKTLDKRIEFAMQGHTPEQKLDAIATNNQSQRVAFNQDVRRLR